MKAIRLLIVLAFLLLAATGCSNQSTLPEGTATPSQSGREPAAVASGSPAPPDAEPAEGSPEKDLFFEINEVVLGPQGSVALTNFTDVSFNLAGYWLCQGSACFELPEEVVGGGETVRVSLGTGAGLENVVASGATLSELRATDGEIGLFASSEFDDPQAMVAYYQWGSTPHEHTQTAIDAGLWVEGGYGPSSERATRLFRAADTGLWLFEEP